MYGQILNSVFQKVPSLTDWCVLTGICTQFPCHTRHHRGLKFIPPRSHTAIISGGMSAQIHSSVAYIISEFSTIQEDEGQTYFKSVSSEFPKLYNLCNLCSRARPSYVRDSWPLARIQVLVLENTGYWMVLLRLGFETLSARDARDCH